MAAGDTDTFTSGTITAPEQPDASMSEAYSGDDQPRVSVAPKSSVVVRPVQTQPSQPQVPRDALSRAYHTLNFLQRNPQWLADPDTQHAAQLDLQNSSRIIEMSIQLERVNQMADTAKLKLNTDTRLVNHLNDGMAKLKDMTAVAAIREEVQANGPSPRAISMLNTALDAEKPISKETQLNDTPGWMDPKGNFHPDPTALINKRDQAVQTHIGMREESSARLWDKRFAFQQGLLDRKEFTAGLNSEIKFRLKKFEDRFQDSQKEIDELRKANIPPSDPKFLNALARQAALGIEQNDFLDTIRPKPVTEASSANAPVIAAPPGTSEGQRVRNKTTGKMGTVKNGVVVPDPDTTQ